MTHELPVILAGPFGLGAPEIIGLVFLMVLLFGAKRLPELARGVGQSLKEFKKASSSADDDHDADEAPSPAKNGTSKSSPKPATTDSK
jgi:sec-independent protein translocase protein TatA